MIHPKISFDINPKKDFDTLCAFTADAEYDEGRNLDWAIFKKYPFLKQYFKKEKYYKIDDKKALLDFINREYRIRKQSIQKAIKKHEKRWRKKEKQYFILTDQLFEQHKWPKGKYVAYSTIWGMYPRFLEDKTFQIPDKHRTPKYVQVVIAHELLHFIFYDYFLKRYPKYKKDDYDFFVWNVSEIFNTVVQNSPFWLKCFKMKSLGYPEHKKIVNSLIKKWYRKYNIELNKLTDDIIQKVEK